MATITLTQIPFSSPDLIRPGAGAEQWHNGTQGIPNPSETSNLPSLDVYYRFQWVDIEGPTQGSYSWTYLDGLIQGAINKGQKLSFGIMSYNGDGGDTSYDGGSSAYPLYLHNLMKGEANKDFLIGSIWCPNYNSTYYITRLRALHQAIRDHLINTSYVATSGPNVGKSILLANAIYCIDIRGFGNWGEWHTGGMVANWTSWPSGRQPSVTSLKAIIDTHTQVFDRWPLVMMVAAYDGGYTTVPLFAPYPELAYYALTAKNTWGDVGFRRDQWGDPNIYLKNLMENNNGTYNGVVFKNLIVNKYKTAPVTGEPNPISSNMADLDRQIRTHHATSFGNGNFGNYPALAIRDIIRTGFKTAGYRLTIEAGSYTNTNSSISITLNWKNTGVSPTYENWDVSFYLKSSTGVLTPIGTSSFKPKLFQPSSTSTTVIDNFNFYVGAGTYTLVLKVTDPLKVRTHMPLFITGIQSDGSYNLGSVVISTATTTTQPPTTTTTTTSTPATTTTTTTSPRKIVSITSKATYTITYSDGSTETFIN